MTESITSSRVSAPLRGHSALSRVIAVSADDFASRYWGREPLVSRADDLPGAIGELFSVAAVDELVSRRGLRAPFLRVAKNGTTYGDRDFTEGGGVGATVADQVSDDKLLRLFAGGATLVLQGLHRTWPALIGFSQQLAEDLGHPVQANAYVTPAQNTGFSDHYDVHDVFVIQVSGEKTWRVRPPVHSAPLRDEPWSGRRVAVEQAARQPPLLEFTLSPGDCLYLPRGFLHSATALGGVSTHLTLGVHVWTRRHLADELLALAVAKASRDQSLRTSLPALVDASDATVVGDDVEIARAALMRALADLEVADVAQAIGAKVRRSQRAAPLSPVTQTLDAAELGEHDGIRLREHLAATLVPTAEGAVVRSRVADFRVTTDELAAISQLLSRGVATVSDLGLELARRLLLAGLAVHG
ncbi:MAG: cupin domain-containing protein [Humibacillus sp.]|nr:cupin domain-containing protein [Humibacillus sp.]MDN5780243.1 cupin domain-containing protein [Humibacillus sp.]